MLIQVHLLPTRVVRIDGALISEEKARGNRKRVPEDSRRTKKQAEVQWTKHLRRPGRKESSCTTQLRGIVGAKILADEKPVLGRRKASNGIGNVQLVS